MKGLIFIASAIGMNIGNPFNAAKRMVKDDFEDLKGKDISVFIIDREQAIEGRIQKVKKGYVIIKSDQRSFYVNTDRIDYIEA